MAREIKIKILSIKEIVVYLKNKITFFLSFCSLCIIQALKLVFNDLKKKKWRGLISLAFSIFIYFFWGFLSSLLWLLFLLFLVYDWENRIIAVFALISLVSCPFLLYFNKDSLAEQMAVYAYFFLVMTVVLQIIEYKRHPELSNEFDPENEEK